MERNILIADDHAIVRYGVSLLIKEEMPSAVITESSSFNETVALLSEKRFHLLILDINLPGGNSIQMLDTVRLKNPNIKVLIFTAYDEHTLVMRYMQAGANGYLVKDSSDEEIRRAIRTVLNNRQYISETLQDMVFADIWGKQKNDNPLHLLSNRETDVLQLILQGKSIPEIADILHIHATTVSTYKTRIFEKMKTKNLVELVEKHRFLNNSN